jgi:hypothetical protein
LAKLPVSFAIHIEAIVPDVNKKAIRKGRGAAAWVSLAGANASIKKKSSDMRLRAAVSTAAVTKRRSDSILFFSARTPLI